MNNQITILDRNNQSLSVDLICYFSSNNKKYVFYNKNETVQDGLIKMYVAEENTGLFSDITQDEWNNLKKVMQGIITGNNAGIEFLVYSNPVMFNEPKAIALNDANINAIKTAYKNATQTSVVSEPLLNKDILSQNFGNNKEVSVSTSEPIQINAVPNLQNNFNMESTPVNLNTVPVVENANNGPVIEPINQEPVIPNVEPIQEPVTNNVESSQTIDDSVLNINSIKPGGIDSGFKVSNEPNIFDNPSINYPITEEEINNPSMPEVNNAFNTTPVVENTNVTSDVDIDLNTKKIELNNRKIKLFEELANIYKEENELLKNESSNESDSVLERTASNLFNSNGTLNDNEVLG